VGLPHKRDRELEDSNIDQLDKVKNQFEDFLNATEVPRAASARCRAYKNNQQWTQAEIDVLNSRRQAPVTNNHIKPKIEGLKGLIAKQKTDPKAHPRTEKHTAGAEAITDALRYVNDNTNLDMTELSVADNLFTEGYGAVIIETKNTKRGREIEINHIPWDRYYFDPHSTRLDFSDKRFDGIVIWMDVEVVAETFKVKPEDIDLLLNTQLDSDTFDDKPQWIDKKRKRVRVCQHFFIDKGVWMMCYFTAHQFLMKPKPSPYHDDEGEPMNPIEAETAYIDVHNYRFGEAEYLIDQQDEINHRHSKYLFLLSSRQTAAPKGAVEDIPAMKREMSKPDGHIEYKGAKGEFDILPTNDMAQAQFTLLQEAKAEMGAKSFSTALAGSSQADLSGKAEQLRQSAATTELASLYAGHSNWKVRVYRQSWMRIKQFWDKEKWIRVLDDQTKLRWVGLNQQVTFQQQMEETINDLSLDEMTRRRTAKVFTRMMEIQDPRLQEIIEVRNDVAELDVDIIIEQSIDSITAMAEEFELLSNVAQTRPEIPFTSILRLSNVRQKTKDEIIKEIKAQQESIQQSQQAAQQKEDQKTEVDMLDKGAKAKKNIADSVLTEVQTQLLLESPPADASVVI